MKCTTGKLETLGDGSVKLSVYFQREHLLEAAELTQCEYLDVKPYNEGIDVSRTEFLSSVKGAMERLSRIIENEITQKKE